MQWRRFDGTYSEAVVKQRLMLVGRRVDNLNEGGHDKGLQRGVTSPDEVQGSGQWTGVSVANSYRGMVAKSINSNGDSQWHNRSAQCTQ